MPGSCAASSCILFIASPELVPGAACPEISYAEMPEKRVSDGGAVDQEIFANDENGAI